METTVALLLGLSLFFLAGTCGKPAVPAFLLFVLGACSGNPFSNPLHAYQGCTSDSVLVQKQFEAVKKTIRRTVAAEPGNMPELSHPFNATQTFTFDAEGKVTTCWAFEFRESSVGDAPVYHNVLLVIDGEACYYAADEMYQPRTDGYLRLSAVNCDGQWKPATFYQDLQWKCVGYETCNRYGAKKTEVHEWAALFDKAGEMGLELDPGELPLVKAKK